MNLKVEEPSWKDGSNGAISIHGRRIGNTCAPRALQRDGAKPVVSEFHLGIYKPILGATNIWRRELRITISFIVKVPAKTARSLIGKWRIWKSKSDNYEYRLMNYKKGNWNF